MSKKSPETPLRLALTLDAIPVGEIPAGAYIIKHVETRLTHGQGTALRRLWYGLDRDGLRLADGRRVQSNAQAVCWLLEQLAVAVEA